MDLMIDDESESSLWKEREWKNERFEKVYTQGAVNVTEVWVDRETGVNYLFHVSGYAGGLTPLLDAQGNPVVTPVLNK